MFAVPVGGGGGRKRRAECVCGGGSFDGGDRAGEMPPPPTCQARRGLQAGEDIVSHWWSRKDEGANPVCVWT